MCAVPNSIVCSTLIGENLKFHRFSDDEIIHFARDLHGPFSPSIQGVLALHQRKELFAALGKSLCSTSLLGLGAKCMVVALVLVLSG
jgi:hypothetical protein